MKKKIYYQLLSEYNNLITQKRFNPYLVNRNRLCEVKKLLDDELKLKMRRIAAEIISGTKHDGVSERSLWLEQKRWRISWMAEKIQAEEILSDADYADTYYEPKFIAGLTLPQFLIAALVSAAVMLIHWLFNH